MKNDIDENVIENSIDEIEDEIFDFNDLDTDERINGDIIKFDNQFPDP